MNFSGFVEEELKPYIFHLKIFSKQKLVSFQQILDCIMLKLCKQVRKMSATESIAAGVTLTLSVSHWSLEQR